MTTPWVPSGVWSCWLKVGRQSLDRHAVQSALLAAAGQIALVIAFVLCFQVELAESHRQIQCLAVTVDLQVHGGAGGKARNLQPE